MIEPADEELHDVGHVPHWQESYYFNWADPDGREFGLSRLGIADGKATALLLTIRDGRLETLYGLPKAPYASDSGGISAKRLSYRMNEPLQSWRIHLGGSREVDLTWDATCAPVDFPALETTGQAFDQRHFEQVGEVHGHLSVNGDRRSFSGTGHRDKSWGARDWDSIPGWEWIVGQFEGGFAFNATVVHGSEGSQSFGFVLRDGVTCPVVDVDCEFSWGRREHVMAELRLSFIDELGRNYELHGIALGHLPLTAKGMFLQETHTRWTARFDGQRLAGVGVTEHGWHAGAVNILKRLPDLFPVIRAGLRDSR